MNKFGNRALLCACGCGAEILVRPWHKYRNVRFVSGHNIRPKNPLSLLDTTKDTRKNQTGFLAPKTVCVIKSDALKAGYAWFLDDVFVFELIKSDCSYCGAPSLWPCGRNGIDRVDSTVGYIKNNCVACCKICNRAKSNLTKTEFMAWVKRIYGYQLKNGGGFE